MLALLLACAHPIPEASVGHEPSLVGAQTLRESESGPISASWRAARRGTPPPTPEVDLLDGLGPRLSGLELDESYGTELADALAAEDPDELAEWGAGVLTAEELFGAEALVWDEALCETPRATTTFEEDGLTWEVGFELTGLATLLEPPALLYMELSSDCASAVDAAGGDVDAALEAGTCSEGEQVGFFDEGSDCLSCVQGGTTVADCQLEGACAEEAPLLDRYAGSLYAWAGATALLCAPDVTIPIYLALRESPSDGSLPGSWNQTDWPWVCLALRDEDSGEVQRTCFSDSDGLDEITDGYGDGSIGRIAWLREEGEEGTPHAGRIFYARSLSFTNGMESSYLLLTYSGIGVISAPMLFEDVDEDGEIDDDDWASNYGGWGLNPLELRPDGTDPTDIDDTYARDWLGVVVTKSATTRAGVPINFMNGTRCEEWVGPHEDGSWTCTRNGTPELGWFVDNHTFWYTRSKEDIISIPLMTLASTGLPDEWMPGGFVPHLAGTEYLSNPDWDDCTWPHQFVPDHIRTEDTPVDWTSPASLDAHTYKWGKDPDQDLRIVLATTQARGFCPSEEE